MDDRTHPLDRRAVLGALAVGLAGCGEGATTTTDAASDGEDATTTTDAASDGEDATTTTDAASDGEDATATTDAGAPNGDGGSTTTEPSSDGSLDLAEANVTGVETAASGDGVRFDVTLYHDDDGEEGYANWWQVESRTGERLGRRDLVHPHGTRPFTRSTTVDLPTDVDCVVVRGHDQTHGYGGQAMLVSVGSGATAALRQGSEPESAAEEPCP